MYKMKFEFFSHWASNSADKLLYFQEALVLYILYLITCSGKQWRSQPKNLGGPKCMILGEIILFCLDKRLSKHKMTIFSKSLGGNDPFAPPGYAYGAKLSLHAAEHGQ